MNKDFFLMISLYFVILEDSRQVLQEIKVGEGLELDRNFAARKQRE